MMESRNGLWSMPEQKDEERRFKHGMTSRDDWRKQGTAKEN